MQYHHGSYEGAASCRGPGHAAAPAHHSRAEVDRPIFNRPFLHYQLDLIKQVPEIDEVILSLNYQPHRIEEVFGDGRDAGIKLRYVVEPTPLGTAGAVRYAAQGVRDTLVVFNGDVLTQVDLRGAHRFPSRPPRARHHRPDAGRQSRRPTAWSRPMPTSNILRFLEKPKPEEITCNTINAGIYVLEPETFDRIPADVAWSIERSFFPSFIERGETFLASIYRDYWIDIGTPEKYMQVHRDIMDGRYSMPPFNGEPGHGVGFSDGAASMRGRASKGRCSSMRAASSKAGARLGPYTVLGKNCQVESKTRTYRAPSSGPTRASAGRPT